MSDNDWKKRLGVVYSTRSDYDYESEEEEVAEPEVQLLYVSLDKKQRAGKKVTLIQGFEGSQESLKRMANTLKSKCGVGGSAKNGEILIQGDFRKKIVEILQKMNHKVKQKGG